MYFIDVSQSVEPSHPHGLEFLHRDCENISNFFSSRIGKDTDTEVMQPHELFTHITGAKESFIGLHYRGACFSAISNFCAVFQ